MSLTHTGRPVSPSVPTPPSSRRSWVRWVPVAGAAGFAAAVVLGTLAAPAEYDGVRDTISVLAAADNPYGAVMVAGFLSLALGLLVAGVRIWRTLRVPSGRVAAGSVVVAGVALAVAGLNRVACNPALARCQADLDRHVPTATQVHGRAALFVFAPLLVAGFALARAVWRLGDRRLALLCLLVAVLDVALVLLVEDAGTPVSGLLQRVFVTTSAGLPILVQAAAPRESPSPSRLLPAGRQGCGR